MEVLHIITGLKNGGAEAVLYRLCTNDTIAKHTVISLMDMGVYGYLLEEKGVVVHYLNMPQGKVTLSGLRKLFSLLKKTKPDVVQTWMYHADLIGGIVARIAGVKRILWNIRHSTLEKGSSKRSTILIVQLCAFLSYFIPSKIVCCAQKALDVHIKLGYQKKKMLVIGNGYELDTFIPSDLAGNKVRDELAIAPNSNIFGMIGRFNPEKDHRNLLEALSLVKHQGIDFKCLLVGCDLNKENVKIVNLINKNNLYENVILLDQRYDIPAIMNMLSIHILSSFSEGFPNVLCEAMACGTPCVTTKVGDASSIVGDTGWVVPSRNSQALADAILKALEEKEYAPEAWAKRKQKCRNRVVQSYSIERMIDNYHRAWRII